MPGMSGPDLHRELKRRRSEIPIVYVTAHGDASTRPEMLVRCASIDWTLVSVDAGGGRPEGARRRACTSAITFSQADGRSVRRGQGGGAMGVENCLGERLQAESPAVVVDHDGDMIGIVEGRRR